MIITDGAKTYIEQMMKEAGISTLRFAAVEGGCCGPSYQLSLDEAKENDTVEMVNEIKVAADPQIASQVMAITMDLVEDEEGTGLVISGGSSCC